MGTTRVIPPYIAARLQALEDQGVEIPDADKAAFYIDRIGWFRFRGYANVLTRPTQPPMSTRPTFDNVLTLYRFDRQLRLLCLDATERIEMSLKGYLQDFLNERYGKWWFNDPSAFHVPEGSARVKQFCINLQAEIQGRIERQPKRGFRRDDEPKFNPLSIMDKITFGDVSKLYSILPDDVRSNIASNYRKYDDDLNLDPLILQNWLKAINTVRNWSAHHNRLWNEKFDNRLEVPGHIVAKFQPTRAPGNWKEKFYGKAVVIFYLLDRVSRNTCWHRRLDSLLSRHLHDGFNLYHEMGFPEDWMRAKFWNPPRTKDEDES